MGHNNLQKYLNLSAPLLITGETGTGKSSLAKKIFEASRINREIFLTVHLATLKEDLLESELFGHKRGAFTGATEVKNGYLLEVGNGTLFLDEIGELSLEAQKKLLYLLEEKKFTPLGSTRAIDFGGRIIMATNKNLKKMVEEGKFREDLYYRVAVFELKLPALKENPAQLFQSAQEIFNTLKLEYKKPTYSLSQNALDYILHENWSGNFRELKNALEYALVMSEKEELGVNDFPRKSIDSKVIQETSQAGFLSSFPIDYNESLELFEKMYLVAILEKNAGKVNDTARRLGMSKTTLIQKAKKYKINTLKMRADASDIAA